MTLAELVPGAAIAPEHRDLAVSGLSADSRDVRPGFAFFAVPGRAGDGLAYAGRAVAAGAVAVVSERVPDALPAGVASAVVPNLRGALSAAAARVHPGQPGTVVAVTGTSGKTSVTAFLRQIWAATGKSAASLGTIGIVAPRGILPDGDTAGALTTPDPVTLHRDLDRLAAAGVTHLAVEASSHGLDQRRLDGLRLAAGAFTNLSRDHLDYHSSLDSYLDAKLRLFTELLAPGQPAVIDADEAVSGHVGAAARARGLAVLTVGWRGDDLRLLSAEPNGFATRLALRHAGRDREVRLPLAGAFQVSNALVAAGLALATGTAPDAAFAALEALDGAPGRLQRVGERCGASVFVDYAHKPGALEAVLTALRPYAPGRLVAVFGCGGDRDAGKRPLMGEVASRLADIVIVTDDNPRSEDPAAIRAAVLAGAPGAVEIADRAEAIAHALALLGPGDALVVAGKGHETGQKVGAVTLPFSDAEAVAAALTELPA